MIKKEMMHSLYDVVIAGDDLTPERMVKCGFTQVDLIELLKTRVLAQKDDKFQFLDFRSLRMYGMHLKIENRLDEAYACRRICDQLDSSNLFKSLLQHYEKGNKLFVFQKIQNYYLNCDKVNGAALGILFNYCTELPPEQRQMIMKWKKELEDLAQKNPNDLNEVQRAILQYDFEGAKDSTKKSYDIYSMEKRVILTLLDACIRRSAKVTRRVTSYVDNKDYRRIELFLKEEQKTRGLDEIYTYIFMVVQDYLEVCRSKNVLEKMDGEVLSIGDAIELCDYPLALEMLQSMMEATTSGNLLILKKLVEEIITLMCQIEHPEAVEKPLDTSFLSDVVSEIMNNEKSIESICQEFGLTSEQTCLVKLVFAKGYYRVCYYNYGDILLNDVLSLGIKNKSVAQAIEEARVARGSSWNIHDSFALKLKRMNHKVLLEKAQK
ncbi:MAG: hypothetical protein K2M17_03145 [Bacilli bacterium]|nr:hypothetical protein [Bacilli bacterium]